MPRQRTDHTSKAPGSGRNRKAAQPTRSAPADTAARKPPAKPRYDQDRIRARAYGIYLERNNGSGSALGDWLQAERELQESLRT